MRTRLAILLCLSLTGMLSVGCAKKRAMAGKAEELMNFGATEKLAPNVRVGEKVAVVEKDFDSPPYLEGFNADGTEDIVRFYFSPRRKAQSPEEIDTLVKILCSKGKPLSGSSPTVYAHECDVSLIDYKAKTVFARKKIVNDILDDRRSSYAPDVAYAPSDEIKTYLRQFSSYD